MKKSFAVLLFMLTAGLGLRAIAQHATAFDIEDGGRAFDSSCAGCHGPDGNLIAGIDFRRGIFRRPLADDEIVAIILNGIPNTPMPATPGMSEEQAVRIVAYLRSLPESFVESAAVGDPARGREIFSGDGKCLDCHRVAGRGSRLGPDLSRIGLDRRAAELESSLLDPEAEVQPTNRFYTAPPTQGATSQRGAAFRRSAPPRRPRRRRRTPSCRRSVRTTGPRQPCPARRRAKNTP
jgi:mono/diheme cytochrome c family protein